MKKSLLALAVLGAFAGAASAQSSVTVFGVVDQSINRIDNGGATVTQIASNQLLSNRLGFRGTEDLGGGLKAGFWLEGGMSTENGNSGGLTFGRDSFVNLTGAFGEIRIGHDYTPSFWAPVLYDVNGANGIGEGLNIINFSLGSGAATFVRANDMVQYFLPGGLGGLYGEVGAALGQGVNGNKYVGGRLGWGAGPVDISVDYGDTKTFPGDANGDFKVFGIGASYDFGVAQVLGFYNQNKYGAAKQNAYELSVGVPIGAGQARASYGHQTTSGTAADGSSTLMGLEYVYNLSKLTSLYASYGRISNNNGSAYAVEGTPSGMTAGAVSSGYNAGIKVSF